MLLLPAWSSACLMLMSLLVVFVCQLPTQQGQVYVLLKLQVYQEEFGTVRGHFGPVNAVAFHPDGRRYGLR